MVPWPDLGFHLKVRPAARGTRRQAAALKFFASYVFLLTCSSARGTRRAAKICQINSPGVAIGAAKFFLPRGE